jgi:hypothetical protein
MKRTKKKLNMPEAIDLVAGIAWYSSEQWATLRSVVSDREQLESTYEGWEAVVRRSVRDFINRGMKLVKVPVDVAELVSWCEQRNIPIDAAARAQFVVDTLRQRGASSFESIGGKI